VEIVALCDDKTIKNNKNHDVSILLQVIETLKGTIEDLRGTIASTNQANQHLIAEVKLLREQVAYLTDKRFGRSKKHYRIKSAASLAYFRKTSHQKQHVLQKHPQRRQPVPSKSINTAERPVKKQRRSLTCR